MHPHSHSHSHAPQRVGRRTVAVIAVLLGLIGVGLALLWPTGQAKDRADELGLRSARYAATVSRAETQPCSYDATRRCRSYTLRVDDGPKSGTTVVLPEYSATDFSSPKLASGDHVIVGYEASTDTFFLVDRDRKTTLTLLAAVFAVCVVALGRRKGLMALVSLGLSVVVLLRFIVPAILDGRSPLLVSIVGASAIAVLALYLTHGVNDITTAALAGTLSALAITAVLSSVFYALAHVTGLAEEEAVYVRLAAGTIDLRGLLLGGAVLGALGALDDVTITQAAAVHELHLANPGRSARELYASAIRIGRDHVGSTVNTLLLAYAGASMPLLLLFELSGQSFANVANSEVVAVEIIRTLVGSIGLIAAVPLTTALATFAVTRTRPGGDHHAPDGTSDGLRWRDDPR